MKRRIFYLFLCSPIILAAQNNPHSIDPRLYDVYDNTYIDDLAKSYPLMIDRWNFYLDEAYFITDSPKEKEIHGDYPTIKIADFKNINILKLEKEQGLSHDWDKMTTYKIEGSNKHLVYFPGKFFIEKLKQHFIENRNLVNKR